MFSTLYRSVMATLVMGIILCGIYPLLVTGIGQLFFHDQANGSLISGADGKIIGSRLIGQSFTKPEYFHGRPSAAGNGYDATSSSGSNLGPTNQKFFDGLKANADSVLKDNPTLKKGELPGDLVTASGSGLDPHVSPEGALVQVSRVAGTRGISVPALQELVAAHTEGPQWGLFGESVVNVLELNLELDHHFPIKK